MQDTFNGENITRGFYFMPQFLFFSIIFCLIFQKNYPVVSWILLGINVLAVYISYTRSYLIIVVLIFLLYFVFTGLKRKKLAPVFKNIFLYSILAIIAVFVISKIFPNKTKYFQERFTELTKPSSPMDGPNDLEYRFMNAEDIISTIKENKKMLGMGPISEKQSPKVTEMKNVTADMVWTGVIYRWGFVGLTLFALIYLFSLFYSFKLYINSEKAISDMALLFLLYIISQIIESFVSWTFMSGHGLTTGFWYFGMLSAILKLYSSPFSYLNKKHPNKFLLKSSH
jgi:O-antigen ligase